MQKEAYEKTRMTYLDSKIVNLTQKMSKDMNYRFALDESKMEKKKQEIL